MSTPDRFNAELAVASAERVWEGEILPALAEYIRIPNESQAFDRAWREHGHMERAVALIEGWCRAQQAFIPGLVVEVHRLGDRAPVILMEIPGSGGPDTVLLYGHLDKQPEMTGWREGLSPWSPVREGDRLYGRGGADDGYSAFASLTALRLLHEQGVPHARAVVLIEAGEESGSPDLPAYIEALAARIGSPCAGTSIRMTGARPSRRCTSTESPGMGCLRHHASTRATARSMCPCSRHCASNACDWLGMRM